MADRGTPSKLSPFRIQTILDSVRAGAPMRESCQLAGISEQTLRNWKRRGERYVESEDADGEDSERQYFDFFGALKRAEVEGMVSNLTVITRSGHGGMQEINLPKGTTHILRSGHLVKLPTIPPPNGKKQIPIDQIIAIRDPEWQAAAWLLERKFPRDFARRQVVLEPERDEGMVEGLDLAKWANKPSKVIERDLAFRVRRLMVRAALPPAPQEKKKGKAAQGPRSKKTAHERTSKQAKARKRKPKQVKARKGNK